MLDVRSEADYNLFRLVDACRVELDELADESRTGDFLDISDHSVIVLMSDDEVRATEGWKLLAGQSLLNVHILEDGINGWLDLFGHLGHAKCSGLAFSGDGSRLRHLFESAVEAKHPSADPDSYGDDFRLEYTPKVKLQRKRALGGGCA